MSSFVAELAKTHKLNELKLRAMSSIPGEVTDSVAETISNALEEAFNLGTGAAPITQRESRRGATQGRTKRAKAASKIRVEWHGDKISSPNLARIVGITNNAMGYRKGTLGLNPTAIDRVNFFNVDDARALGRAFGKEDLVIGAFANRRREIGDMTQLIDPLAEFGVVRQASQTSTREKTAIQTAARLAAENA